MFAAINLGIVAPGLLYVTTSLFQHVRSVEPALEMPAAELSLGILLVAGTLPRLLDLDLVMRKLRRSLRSGGCGCGQGIYPRRSGRMAAGFGCELFILLEAFGGMPCGVQANGFFGGGCSAPTRPTAISATK